LRFFIIFTNSNFEINNKTAMYHPRIPYYYYYSSSYFFPSPSNKISILSSSSFNKKQLLLRVRQLSSSVASNNNNKQTNTNKRILQLPQWMSVQNNNSNSNNNNNKRPLFIQPSNIDQELLITPHSYSVLSSKGFWPQEDRVVIIPNIAPQTTIYGVFDGHQGSTCSQYIIDHLEHVMKNVIPQFPDFQNNQNQREDLLSTTFKQLDDDYLISHSRSGSTAVVMCVCNNHITVANTGDSRGILVLKQKQQQQQYQPKPIWKPLSVDHKVDLLSERERVIRGGATISLFGEWRVNGLLAMTRALGDATLKHVVIPDPTCYSFDLPVFNEKNPENYNNYYIVLATDGVWALLRSDQVARMIQHTQHVSQAAQSIAKEIENRGIVDNTTVMVIELSTSTSCSS
jgi:protein phosphatase 1L